MQIRMTFRRLHMRLDLLRIGLMMLIDFHFMCLVVVELVVSHRPLHQYRRLGHHRHHRLLHEVVIRYQLM